MAHYNSNATMILSWKERLYAYLLRKVLSPWLDDASLEKLHQSIEVSLQQGTFVLKNIGLDTRYIQSKLPPQLAYRITQATLERLDISLSLEEVHEDNEGSAATKATSSSTSSQGSITLAWKAMTRSSSNNTAQADSTTDTDTAKSSSSKIALVARVVLEGIVLHVEPKHAGNAYESDHDRDDRHSKDPISQSQTAAQHHSVSPQSPPRQDDEDDAPDASSKSTFSSYLSSYVEAALASLRLSVQLQRLTVRLEPDDASPWIELSVQAASYQDEAPASSRAIHKTASSSSSSSYQTIMHKAVDVTKVSISVGGSLSSYDAYNDDDYDYSHEHRPGPTVLVLLDGTSRLRVRAVEYLSHHSTMHAESHSTISSTTKAAQSINPNSLQHDIEVSLGQRLNLFVDTDALHRLDRIANTLKRLRQAHTRKPVAGGTQSTASKKSKPSSSSLSTSYKVSDVNVIGSSMVDSVNNSHFSASPTDNEADYKAIERIVTEQYQEARLHAERNEIRGGLLLPTTGDDGHVSFDAFFDANDQSFYRYSHMVQGKTQSTAETLNGKEIHDSSFVHTKVKLHLPSARVKVMLKDDSYLLLTLTDVEASTSMAQQFTNHSGSIANMELEQAAVLSGTFAPKISTIFNFVAKNSHQSTGFDDGLLVQAPSLSLAVSTIKEKDEADSEANDQRRIDIDIDMNLEPFVIVCPMVFVGDLLQFHQSLPSRSEEAPKQENDADKTMDFVPKVSMNLECPHFDLCIPIASHNGDEEQLLWTNLFERAGLPAAQDCSLTESAVGSFVERLTVQYKDGNAEATFERIFGYGYLQSDATGQRRTMDFVSLCGGTNPALVRICNVSQRHDTSSAQETKTTSNETRQFSLFDDAKHDQSHPAAALFPRVPAISSFKAFQEDEDEDTADDDVGLSPSRRELTGPDPQPEMLQSICDAAKTVEFHLPSIHCDLTINEIEVLIKVLSAAFSLDQLSNNTFVGTVMSNNQSNNQDRPNEVVSIYFSCQEILLAIHDDAETLKADNRYSYVVQMDHFRGNLLHKRAGLQHVRVLTHDLSLFEATNIAGGGPITSELNSEGRAEAMRNRCRLSQESFTPLLHRSYLFRPISRQSPCFLLDIMDISGDDCFVQKSIHFTLYDVTYRYDYDSKWIDRFNSLLHNLSARLQPKTEEAKEGDDAFTGSLTRVFFCLADCNLDYTSSMRWKTKTRQILRLGELRVSSNMVRPSASLQAVKLALGDASLYICNSRFPYSFENGRIFHDHSSVAQSSDDILRKMNFRTLMMLDALDAVLTIANDPRLHDSHPRLHVNLTIGQFNFFACKDSFAVFAGSVSEVCSEACAMNEETYTKLKEASDAKHEAFYDSVPHEDEVSDESKETMPHLKLEDLKKKSALIPAVGTSNTEATFLLDGYDWTTIDQDESNSSRIPMDDEQVAKWYGSELQEGKPTILRTGSQDECDSSGEAKPNPLRIISHHFPLQLTSDPLGDGDMGASKLSGTGYSPSVKSRLSICDLSLKIRLFDGYDWPDALPDELQSVERSGKFVIDLDPESLAPSNEEGASQMKQESTEVNRKAALMAGLLDTVPNSEESKTFQDLPLPQERGARLKSQAIVRRLGRRSDKYFQFSATGIQVRSDSMVESDEYRLASCLNIKVRDFFAAETISSNKPIKMAGEWFNDMDHPRDTNDGLLMMKVRSGYQESKQTFFFLLFFNRF